MNAYFTNATYGLQLVIACVSHQHNIDKALEKLESLEKTFYDVASQQYERFWETQIIGYLNDYKKFKTTATILTIAIQDLMYLKLTSETNVFAEYKYLFLTPKVINRSVYESIASF